MPEQKLHTHEEVFKDHVSGQHDETIFRFRVPGGWIYTHTIIRFGSVDKNYVADTFVPDSKVDMDLPISMIWLSRATAIAGSAVVTLASCRIRIVHGHRELPRNCGTMAPDAGWLRPA